MTKYTEKADKPIISGFALENDNLAIYGLQPLEGKLPIKNNVNNLNDYISVRKINSFPLVIKHLVNPSTLGLNSSEENIMLTPVKEESDVKTIEFSNKNLNPSIVSRYEYYRNFAEKNPNAFPIGQINTRFYKGIADFDWFNTEQLITLLPPTEKTEPARAVGAVKAPELSTYKMINEGNLPENENKHYQIIFSNTKTEDLVFDSPYAPVYATTIKDKFNKNVGVLYIFEPVLEKGASDVAIKNMKLYGFDNDGNLNYKTDYLSPEAAKNPIIPERVVLYNDILSIYNRVQIKGLKGDRNVISINKDGTNKTIKIEDQSITFRYYGLGTDDHVTIGAPTGAVTGVFNMDNYTLIYGKIADSPFKSMDSKAASEKKYNFISVYKDGTIPVRTYVYLASQNEKLTFFEGKNYFIKQTEQQDFLIQFKNENFVTKSITPKDFYKSKNLNMSDVGMISDGTNTKFFLYYNYDGFVVVKLME